jgi:hypothetical protein
MIYEEKDIHLRLIAGGDNDDCELYNVTFGFDVIPYVFNAKL